MIYVKFKSLCLLLLNGNRRRITYCTIYLNLKEIGHFVFQRTLHEFFFLYCNGKRIMYCTIYLSFKEIAHLLFAQNTCECVCMFEYTLTEGIPYRVMSSNYTYCTHMIRLRSLCSTFLYANRKATVYCKIYLSLQVIANLVYSGFVICVCRYINLLFSIQISCARQFLVVIKDNLPPPLAL